MNQRVRFVSIVALLIFGGCAMQAQQNQDSYQAMSDKFFDMLQHDKTSDAIDYMFSTNPNMKKVPDQIEQLKSQFAALGPLVGPYISHSVLVETRLGGVLVYQHYLVAYERQPISIRIKYYKPHQTWRCFGLQFDANLTDKVGELSDTKIALDKK